MTARPDTPAARGARACGLRGRRALLHAASALALLAAVPALPPTLGLLPALAQVVPVPDDDPGPAPELSPVESDLPEVPGDPGPAIAEDDPGFDPFGVTDPGEDDEDLLPDVGPDLEIDDGDVAEEDEDDLGVAGDDLGGAEDLDPTAPADEVLDDPVDDLLEDVLGDPLDADAFDGVDVLGRVDGVFDRPRRGDRSRRPRPDLGRLDQRGPGGLLLRFGVGLRLRSEGDPELSFGDGGGRETDAVLDLDLGLLSETRNQTFSADLDTGLIARSNPDGGQEEFETLNPRFLLAYEREASRARLGAVLRLERTDLGEFTLLDLDETFIGDVPDADDLALAEDRRDQGTRTDINAEVEVVAGIDLPVGLEVEVRTDRRRFDSADPSLSDRDIDEVEAAIRLSPDRNLDLRLTYAASRLSDEAGDERDTDTYGVSAGYRVGPATTLFLSLGRREIEALRPRDLDGDGLAEASATTSSEGLGALFDVSHELPRGRIGLELEREVEEGGDRDRAEVFWARELLEGVDLSVGVGVTQLGDGDPGLVADLGYRQALRRSVLTASYRRAAGTNTDGDNVSTDTVRLGVLREINRLSSLALDLDFVRLEGQGDDDPDRTESEVRLSYLRELTPDWSLETGYEYSRRTRDGETADSGAVFLSLARDLVIRP